MEPKKTYAEFCNTFFTNVWRRSRTAKGEVNTKVSGLKLPLLLTGEDLQGQLNVNLQKTAGLIHKEVAAKNSIDPAWCESIFNVWFDQLQYGLLDLSGYREKGLSLGLLLANYRYRIWEVNYNPTSPKPMEIGARMQVFYRQLIDRMPTLAVLSDIESVARLLAFVDRELDSVIHPWLDGCGRFATAVVMWVAARVSKMPLPQFGMHEEHYKAIKTLETHTDYFLRCLGG
jgi:hypothetical protein